MSIIETILEHIGQHEDIGRGTYYAPDVRFQRYAEEERIKIGNYCSIARGVTISVGGGHNHELVSTFPWDSLRSYQTSKNTTIGHDVWIGENAYVGGGATIGSGCVIGANAVVVGREIPPYAIVVGNPGTYLVKEGNFTKERLRFDKETIRRLLRTAWWDWPHDLILERQEWFYKPVQEFLREFDPGD